MGLMRTVLGRRRWIAALLALSVPLAMMGGVAIGDGDATVPSDRVDPPSRWFTRIAPDLPPSERRAVALGRRLFLVDWQVAPGPDPALDGLGPTFGRVSCAGCHRNNARGAAPEDPAAAMTAVIRVATTAADADGHPLFGRQVNPRAIAGVRPEGWVRIAWDERPGVYGDGTPFTLRRPRYRLYDGGSDGEPTAVAAAVRVAPALIGMGLIDAVPIDAIRAHADPEDADGDGISGRISTTIDLTTGERRIGRFGWQAEAASLADQTALAAHEDMGLTSARFPNENCTSRQAACAGAARGTTLDLSARQIDQLVWYLRALAVPPGRPVSESAAGRRLFDDAGCGACHRPTLPIVTDTAWLGGGTIIEPYTDLLLHDMGAGLAEGFGGADGRGREWRTAPLWGIGRSAAAAGHDTYLHDGRARGLAEAILWHGGEAWPARERFRMMSARDREALLAFLRSL